jgi:hypothetical protein
MVREFTNSKSELQLPPCWWAEEPEQRVPTLELALPQTPLSPKSRSLPRITRRRHKRPVNRRSTARKPISLRVDVLPVFDRAGLPSSAPRRRGVTIDVSASGLRCSQIGYLPVGAFVRLFVGLPDGAPQLSCYARVVRCDMHHRPGYGFKLVGLGPSATDRLSRLVS